MASVKRSGPADRQTRGTQSSARAVADQKGMSDGLEDDRELLVVLAELAFQVVELASQIPVRGHNLAQTHEGPHDRRTGRTGVRPALSTLASKVESSDLALTPTAHAPAQ